MNNRAAINAAFDLSDAFTADTDVSDRPFWENAFCDCCLETCPDCGESARFWNQEQARTELMIAVAEYQPMPPVTETGKLVHVEFDGDHGKQWLTIDEGHLDLEIWYAHRRGDGLSDLCYPEDYT